MTVIETAATVLAAAAVAGLYSLAQYRRRRLESGEEFDQAQFVATVVVGAGFGGAAVLTGRVMDPSAITPDLVGSALVTYGAAVAFTERVYKWVRAEYNNARGR